VPRFLAIAQIINNPESFSVSLRPIVNKPFFRVVETHGQVDMPEAAHLAGVSLKEFYQLNAGFKRQTTDPEGPHRLLVPAYLPVDFEAQITALPIPAHHNTVRYKVKRGDTLFALTKRFDVSAEQIRQLNRLKKDQLPVGHTITLSQANTNPEFLALSQELRLDRIASPRRVTQSTHYKVRRGDTLASIAKRHHVSVANLKRWNHIKGQSVHAGQQLVIQSKASPSKQRVAKNSASKNNSHKVSYKVRPGDTLNSIGRRYNISVKQIRGWNSGSGNLQAGQRLTLFVNRATAQNL
jgi:membrane-bound lytic murein transglycosylase D